MTKDASVLFYALGWLIEQIEEDIPQEQMSKHLISALHDAKDAMDNATRNETPCNELLG